MVPKLMGNQMSKMLKSQVQGLSYLLLNPQQLKHLVVRGTRYRYRQKNKQQWIEWQKYNSGRIAKALRSHQTEIQTLPFNIARKKTITEMISPLGKGLNILDVGGGDGFLGEQLWKMGNIISTIDLPTVSTQDNRSQFLLAVTGDAELLPFNINTFDVVLASEIVEHLWSPNSFLDETYRILKNDGYLIISTPEGKAGLRYDSHKHFFTIKILQQLLDLKFKLIEVKRLTDVGTPTPTIILLFQKLKESQN